MTPSQDADPIEIRQSARGRGVRASRDLPAGAPVLRFRGTVASAPDRHSIQVAPQRHLQPDGQAWAYLNHSCAPNCRIEFNGWSLVTARDIRAGEELTFDYLTTEWDMAAPFQCRCGAADCRGLVRGLRHLPPSAQARLRPRCSPGLVALLDGTLAPPEDGPGRGNGP